MKKMALTLIILGGLSLFVGLAIAIKEETMKPIFVVGISSTVGAILVIVGAGANIIKELNSSKKQEAILSASEKTHSGVIILDTKADHLIDLSGQQKRSTDKQSELIEGQGSLLTKQNGQISEIQEQNSAGNARAESESKRATEINKRHLRDAIESYKQIWPKNGTSGYFYAPKEVQKKFVDDLINVLKPELSNPVLNQDELAFERLSDALKSLNSFSIFLNDPKFPTTRSGASYHDAETSKELLKDYFVHETLKIDKAVEFIKSKGLY